MRKLGCENLRTFSDRALSIQPTGVRKMFDLAGDDVISFGLGEPDFQPPKQFIDAFYNAMLEGHNKYTTTAGLPILREKIAQSWDEYQTGMNSENVCITMSGTNALLNIFLTLVNPGITFYYPNHIFLCMGPTYLSQEEKQDIIHANLSMNLYLKSKNLKN